VVHARPRKRVDGKRKVGEEEKKKSRSFDVGECQIRKKLKQLYVHGQAKMQLGDWGDTRCKKRKQQGSRLKVQKNQLYKLESQSITLVRRRWRRN